MRAHTYLSAGMKGGCVRADAKWSSVTAGSQFTVRVVTLGAESIVCVVMGGSVCTMVTGSLFTVRAVCVCVCVCVTKSVYSWCYMYIMKLTSACVLMQ